MDKELVDFLTNTLRNASVKWPGRAECLRRHRKQVQEGVYKTGPKKGQPKYKFYWNCAKCKKDFRNQEDVEVDHIEEVGGFKGDLHAWALRLFCKQENLQALCIICHKSKSIKSTAERCERNKQTTWNKL